ncbi:putative beta-hexosaminidase [Mytilus trossulus]|uniref:putative beta-hexosaminidase n=1 Tax=Mytilus trossulus TaxID=6551 RepID=UPI0030071E79
MRLHDVVAGFGLLLVLNTALSEANLGNIANSLKVGYDVGRNGLPLDLGPGQRITTYLANITLENIGKTPINPDGWSLYMCHEKLIHPMFYNISGLQFAGGGLILPGNVTVIHIKGCMFSFTPYLGEDPRFKAQPIEPGQTLIIPIVASEFLVSRYSVYPNWYIANRSHTNLIPNTMDNDRKFVGPFEHNIQYTRYINDLDSIKLSPIDRYRGYRFLSKPETKSEILPTPFKKTENTGSVSVNGNWLIDYNGVRNLANIATYLQSSIKGESGLSLRLSNVADGTRKVIQILLSKPAASTNPEAYTLQVNPNNERIVINGFSNAAVINGINTLRSLLAGGRTIKSMTINDYPRFSYRGLELDLASNYFPPSTVKKVIDVMALYKLNKLVLILGEENGWRIEIPEIPSLTKIGSKRCHDPSEDSCLFSQLGSKPDGTDGGYLTVQNYQDLIKYAAVRNIEIIPQIHMGVKARAAIKSMRVHTMTTKDKSMVLQDPTDIPRYMTSTLYSDSAVNPCLPNESTEKFFEFILTKLKKYHESAGVPLKYIHVGGDDSPPPAWLNSTHCQRLLHLEKEDLYLELKVNYSMALGDIATKHGVGLISLEEFFMAWPSRLGPPRIVPFLTPFSRTRFGNSSDIISISTTINQFPQRRRPQLMANSGYKVILQPSDYTALQFAAEPDSEMPGEYDSRTRFINATKVFNFLPENLCCNFELTDAGSFGCTVPDQCEPLTEKDNVLGMQASLSTRFVKDEDTLFKLLLPRLIPFAERAYHKAAWENTYLPPKQIFNPQTGPEVVFSKPDLVARDEDWTRVASIIGNKEYPRLVNVLNIKPNVLPPGAKKEKMGTKELLRVDTSYPGLTPQIKSSLADWSNIKNTTDVTTLKLKDFQMRTLLNGKQNRRLESIEQTMPLVYLSLKQEILGNVTKIRREMELERQRQMQAAQAMEFRRRQAMMQQQQQASQFARAQMGGTNQFNQFGMPQQPAQQAGATGVTNQQTAGTATQAAGTPVQQQFNPTG